MDEAWRDDLAQRLHAVISARPEPATKGLVAGPDASWAPALARVPATILVRGAASVVRALLLPEYAERRPQDRRPMRAVEAAEAWLVAPATSRALHAKAVAKACTHARKDTLGAEHRIAEAARAVATAVTRASDDAMRRDAIEALAYVEEHLLERHAIAGEHDRRSEVRERMVAALGSALV